MGCFCRNLIPTPEPEPEEPEAERAPPENRLVEAVAASLAARWLPAATPWEPDDEWQEIEWPEVELPAASVGVLASLSAALHTILITLQIDIGDPTQVDRLTRVIATLNARLPELQEMEEDRRPWLSLLQLTHQTELVEQAAQQALFEEEPEEPVLPAWRPVLRKVMALAPLVAIGQQLKLDWTDPDVTDRLQIILRVLATIRLPQLRDAALVLRLVARFDAIARLQASLGADPRPHAFHKVQAAVQRRADKAAALLPDQVRLRDGVLVGLPAWEPNLGAILNPATIAQARLITPETLARMRWRVPSFDQFSVLTVGLPAAHLVGAMAKLQIDPVRHSPCGQACDAARVMRDLTTPAPLPDGAAAPRPDGAKAPLPGGATAPMGSGTDAVPAG